ncbi:MAG: LysR family transcriptional regulator [Treponema sp.]|nr:LysR family transcriptional regulator [Treponema sp.]
MTLQQIRYIIGVAEAGSLNKASERLFISQPSLSSSLHDTEDELGFQIFTRSARGVKVTEQGESFIRDARDLYLQYENLLKKHCGIEKKRFSVSALYYAFARKAFVQIVKEFSDSGYDFAFCEKKALDVIDDVAGGKSEIGILYLSDANRAEINKTLDGGGLVFHHLTECNAFVYLHKNHPLAKKESLSLDELVPYHFVTFDTDDVKSFFSEEVISHYGLDKAITVADRATELNLLEQLNGYTFLSGVFGKDANEAGVSGDSAEHFVLIPLKNPDGKISHNFELGYITKNGVHMDNVSLTYIDAIRRILNIAGFTC